MQSKCLDESCVQLASTPLSIIVKGRAWTDLNPCPLLHHHQRQQQHPTQNVDARHNKLLQIPFVQGVGWGLYRVEQLLFKTQHCEYTLWDLAKINRC